MFAGAGGLSEGFFRHNFNFISHIEMNPFAALTLETRSIYHGLKKCNREDIYTDYFQNISEKSARQRFIKQWESLEGRDINVITEEISNSSENSIINGVDTRLKEHNNENVDVIIGGPPCQAYSLIGRGRDPEGMKNDPRNTLYLHYLKFLKKLSPEIFVFENVPGIKTARNGEIFTDFQNRATKLGYTVKSQELNALDFGVLQDRKRVIIIGWKNDHDLDYPSFEINRAEHNIWDLLEDLPSLKPGEGTNGLQKYKKKKPSQYLRESGIRNGEHALLHHEARKHNDRDRKIYRKAIKLWNTERKRLSYDNLPANLRTHKNITSFLDRFKVVDGDYYSHSIVAHLSKDGHHFIHPDYKQARSITVREAARIQSFPDNYIFEGPRTAQYVQIGNAVPPLMAEGIAKKIEEMLQGI
jgi:DNA (cytosine-5)-methyltransferase 1